MYRPESKKLQKPTQGGTKKTKKVKKFTCKEQ